MKMNISKHLVILGLLSAGVAGAQSGFREEAVDLVQLLSPCGVNFETQFGTKFYKNGITLYSEEYNAGWTKDFPAKAQEAAKEIATISNLLAKKNMQLIVVPVPNRTSMLPKSVMGPTGIDVAAMDNAYKEFLGDLKANKVVAIDALTPFKSAASQQVGWAFLTEPHWNEDGSLNIAKLVAPYLKKGSLNINTESQNELRPPGIRPIARNSFDVCHIRMPDVVYKDYKFYEDGKAYFVSGFDGIEEGKQIWSLGKDSKLFFDSQGGKGAVSLGFYNPVDKQSIQIKLNNQTVYKKDIVIAGKQNIELSLNFKKGRNTVEVLPEYTNWDKLTFIPTDNRSLSLYFQKIKITNPDINYLDGIEADLGSKPSSMLDDVSTENILLGTSYSEESPGNNLKFADFLRMFSRADVLNFSRGAGGLTASIRDFIESPQFIDGNPHRLIWEFPLNEIDNSVSGFSQIISSLKFNNCSPNNLKSLSTGNNSLLPAVLSGDVQVIFNDKSTTEMSLQNDSSTLKIINNGRQGSKNIYYFDSSSFNKSQIGIKSNTNSSISVHYCSN